MPPCGGGIHADEAALGVVHGTARYLAEYSAASEQAEHESDEPA
jgi:hypothetical protein